MQTKMIKVNETNFQESVREAGEILKRGGLVAFPTETVYGLGGDALNAKSSEKIYAAKGRPSDNPLIVHICDMEDLEKIACRISEKAYQLAEAYWPGPLTMILNKKELVPEETTGGLETVAVRMPNHPLALALIRAEGGFIAAPSANTSGRPSPTKASHVAEDLDGRIDMILDGGDVGIGLESTIVDFTEESATILRPGYITPQMIKDVIGEVKMDPALMQVQGNAKPKAPGMKYRHYAPRAQMYLVKGKTEDVIAKIAALAEEAKKQGRSVGILCTEESKKCYSYGITKSLGSRKKEEEIAKNLFDVLREFDHMEVDVIYSEWFDAPGIGIAVMNRMLKAAGHQIIDAAEGGKEMIVYQKLVFVSDTDTCLAPIAAAVFHNGPLKEEMEVESRGLVALFPEPINEKAEAIMINKGIPKFTHSAKQLEEEDFQKGTLILAMTKKQYVGVVDKFGDRENLFSLSSYIQAEEDVPDPYGKSLKEYADCVDVILAYIRRLEEKLEELDWKEVENELW